MSGIFNAAMFNNAVFNTGVASVPPVGGSGGGRSSWEKEIHRNHEWDLFTREKARRYDEDFAKFLAKELQLEEAKQALVDKKRKRLAADNARKRVVRLSKQLAAMKEALNAYEDRYEQVEEEHLFVALFS